MFIAPAPLPEPPAGDAARNRVRWGVAWTFVFAGNLCLPLALGWEYTAANGGRVGMLVAVAGLYAAGLRLCLRRGELRGVLTRGAFAVMFTQLFPILQFAAGIGALYGFNQVWRPTEHGFGAEVRAFAVTVTTAVPLGLAAFIFGGGLTLLRGAPATDQVADYG